MNNKKTCKHEICKCIPTNRDDSFCSDRCKDAYDQGITEIGCDCGHRGCDISSVGSGF